MWLSEWDKELRANWKVPGGLSSRLLAEKLGTTKGTVIRRARRIGLAVDTRGPHRTEGSDRSDEVVGALGAVGDVVRDHSRVATILPFVRPAVPAVLSGTVKPHKPAPTSPYRTCQWIDGEPSHNADMCGGHTVPGFSYCSEHKARCYVSRKLAGSD